PIAESINPEKISSYFCNDNLPIHFIKGNAIKCMAAANFVIVASGTASLECALLQKPMCIIYKSSWITYHIVMSLIKVRFLGLCNLLVNKMIVPEFLQYDCNSFELFQYISYFYEHHDLQQEMIKQLSALKSSLSRNQADCSLLELVEEELLLKNA